MYSGFQGDPKGKIPTRKERFPLTLILDSLACDQISLSSTPPSAMALLAQPGVLSLTKLRASSKMTGMMMSITLSCDLN